MHKYSRCMECMVDLQVLYHFPDLIAEAEAPTCMRVRETEARKCIYLLPSYFFFSLCTQNPGETACSILCTI